MYEYLLARKFKDAIADKFSLAGNSKKATEDEGWTLTHSFFANAGGFVLQFEGGELPSSSTCPSSNNEDPEPANRPVQLIPVTTEGLKILLRYKAELPDLLSVKKKEINDKSKQDWLTKSIVGVQGISFAVRCLFARMIHKLTITPLEYMTGILALITTVAIGFQWYKPQGVGCPITIKCRLPPDEVKKNKISRALLKTYRPYIGKRKFDLRKVQRIPFGYLARSQFYDSFLTIPALSVILANAALNFLTLLMPTLPLFHLRGPWLTVWQIVAYITTGIPFLVFCGLVARSVTTAVKEIYTNRGRVGIAGPQRVGGLDGSVSNEAGADGKTTDEYGEGFYRFLDWTGFSLGIVFGLCRLVFYGIGIASLFNNHLPTSAYEAVDWTDRVPGFQAGN